MKRYKEFVNEDITKFMTPKSVDEIEEKLSNLSDQDKVKAIIEYQFDYKYLPQGDLYIEDDLYLSDIGINKLPDNLTIKGYVELPWNELTELPKNLNIIGTLNISYNELNKLPNDLSVSDDLICYGNNNELELPKGAFVGANFYC